MDAHERGTSTHAVYVAARRLSRFLRPIPLGPASVLVLLVLAPAARAQDADPPTVSGGLTVETGILAVFENELQLGRPGSRIDLVTDANEDTLASTSRYTVFATIGRNRLQLLYQPFSLHSTAVAAQDLVFDGRTFAAGSVVDYHYGFDFWRAGWSWDFDSGRDEVALGAALQIRNAAIDIRAADGANYVASHDIGPVPLVTVHLREWLSTAVFTEIDAAGVYAPVRYLNGGGSDVEGSLLDASVRAGFAPVPAIEVAAALRYLGGGAVGTSSGGRFTSNRLQTGTASLSASVRF